MMFSKKKFIATIEVIRLQNEYDVAHAVLMAQVLKVDDVPVYNNSELINHLFSLLQQQFPPGPGGTCEIERYCWELSFGFVGTDRVITPEDLWLVLCDKNNASKKEEKKE